MPSILYHPLLELHKSSSNTYRYFSYLLFIPFINSCHYLSNAIRKYLLKHHPSIVIPQTLLSNLEMLHNFKRIQVEKQVFYSQFISYSNILIGIHIAIHHSLDKKVSFLLHLLNSHYHREFTKLMATMVFPLHHYLYTNLLYNLPLR